MAKKQPPAETPPPPLPQRRKVRSQATPGLWRGLWAWIRNGQLLGFLLSLGSAAVLGYLFF